MASNNKNVKQFLPSVFRTDEIKNFMDSTTETLFSDKDSESTSYYIGRTPGGLYNPLKDYYAQEYNKIRKDYQLEPALIVRNIDTQEVEGSLFYEDLLRSLMTNESQVSDQKKLFHSESFSYSAPIDIDMFINYRDYYWYPEGTLAFHVNANPSDIIGKVQYQAEVVETGSSIYLTTGHHIILNDGNEYIVEGVGKYIELIQFSLTNNIPKKIDRIYDSATESSASMIEKFPQEYITMQRGSVDENPWSRNNSWYHKDSINLIIGTNVLKADKTRRASRPIICFNKNIELYNYSQNQLAYIRLFGTSLNTAIDGVIVHAGDLVAIHGDNNVYEYDGNNFNVKYTAQDNDKITIMDGTEKANEYKWSSSTSTWVECQLKLKDTQAILFNLYDSNVISDATLLNDQYKYPNSTFAGNKIFSYNTSSTNGIYDSVLGLNLVYKAFKDSSDITYKNYLEDVYTYTFNGATTNIDQKYYKIYNPLRLQDNIILKFTINVDSDNNENIFVNNQETPNLIIKSNTQYIFDFSDSSTSKLGWSNSYNPIEVLDSNNNTVIKPTHAYSSINKVVKSFTYDPSNAQNNIYTYKSGNYEGKIYVVPQVTDNVSYENGWYSKGTVTTKLYQTKTFLEDTVGQLFEFEFIPTNDNFTVIYNGNTLTSSEYYYQNLTIGLPNAEFKKGDFLEVYYYTNQTITNTKNTIQLEYPSLSNNPFNEDIIEFAYSEIFNHFASIISNQPYLTGTALSNNNYRDTIRDLSKGDRILKNKNSMVPLMFVNYGNNTDVIESILFTKNSYANFKNNIILKTENINKTTVIDNSNVRNVFDDIITSINSGKSKNDPFSLSYMFATYKKYINVSSDNTGKLDNYIDLSVDKNAFYIYTADGLQIIDQDYTLSSDAQTLETTLTPLTFTISDIVEMRYYEDLEPCFCPATPTKFGLSKPTLPKIVSDDTYLTTRYFIIGHDGSKSLAYSDASQITNNNLDARDLVLLEFEKRIYNGINSTFKQPEYNIVDYNTINEGYFRKAIYHKDFINELEFKFFNLWAFNNNVDYTVNKYFDPNNPFTFNYSSVLNDKGNHLPGFWKSIYKFYYDTYTPHITPWEMLGFQIKPTWWDNEYGTDYSASNSHMWGDLEEGIIRQGPSANVQYMAYKESSNIYARPGLSNFIPVDSTGKLLDPIQAGIATTPDYFSSKMPWKFGDYGPAELAWRVSSDYGFIKQIINYIAVPLSYTVRSWDTENSYNNFNDILYPTSFKIHGETINSSKTYVPGLTQWIYDFYIDKNIDPIANFIEHYKGVGVNLANKVGGYVDSTNIQVYTESYNPSSGNITSLIPIEDISILLHESKDIKDEVYSGVIVERIEGDLGIFNFVDGAIYTKNTIVFNKADNHYYKCVTDMQSKYPTWVNDSIYVAGRVVEYNSKLYVCLQDHRSSASITPTNTTYWEVRGFNASDWALLTQKPKTKTTYFKVYGYDIYGSEFNTIPPLKNGRQQKVTSFTKNSKPVLVQEWKPNKIYYKNDLVKLSSVNYVCIKTHTSGSAFDFNYWVKIDQTPYENVATVDVTIDGDKKLIKKVPYGTIFKTEKEVAEFLVGYGRYLESRGWLFDTFDNTRNLYNNWILSVKEFIQWAYENNNEGAVISLSPASQDIRYQSDHGVASVIRDEKNGLITLMDARGNSLTTDDAKIYRMNDIYEIKPNTPIYYCKLTVREYEHSLIFNNTTVFNDVIYDPLYSIRKERLKVNVNKTINWDGKLRANGYIILNNKILPNFQTSIDDVKTISNFSEVSTQEILNTLKYHNVGYQKRQYLEDLEMDDKTQIAFYTGFIRQKGTSDAFQRLLRNDILDIKQEININEEWAFKEDNFGSVINNQYIEFEFQKTDITTSPQLVFLEYNTTFDNKKSSIVYINKNDQSKWITSPTRFSANDNLWGETKLSHVKKMPTAGYVHWSDANYRAFSLSTFNKQLLNSTSAITTGQYVWIAKTNSDEYSWDIYNSQTSNINVTEIITHGKANVSSMVLRLDNVNENDIYGFYALGYTYTFKFKKVDPNDNLYIALSLENDNTYVLLDPSITFDQLNTAGFIVWKNMRINKYYNTIYPDVIDTIDNYISNNSINVNDGLRIYIDDTSGNLSYKQDVLNSSPEEYWTFDNFTNNAYAGSVNSIALTPDSSYVFNSNIEGLINTYGLSGGTGYNPDGTDWPKALWAKVNSNQDISQYALEFWVLNDMNLQFRYNNAVSNTVAGFSYADPQSGEVIVIQLMVYPPDINNPLPTYKVVYMKDGLIKASEDILLEKGFNQIVLNYNFDGTTVTVNPYVNGTLYGTITSNAVVSTSGTYDLYVVCADQAEKDSTTPTIDELAVYNAPLGVADIQTHYKSGTATIFSNNDASNWGVYEYNSGQWNLLYNETPVIDTNLFNDILIYNATTNEKISDFYINDPIKGYFVGGMLDYIHYILEYDPAIYNVNDTTKYSEWQDKVGTLWWDTSQMRYIEYENGDNETRSNFWGALFPESEIVIYEWVKSSDTPTNYKGVGTVKNVDEYLTSFEYDGTTGTNTTYYYFWVKNSTNLIQGINESISPVNIANSIQYPQNNGNGYIEILSNNGLNIYDINNQIIDNNVVLQINYELEQSALSKHSQWTLISESANEYKLPTYLFDKMIDSLLGYSKPDSTNTYGLPVPDPNLANNHKYGNSNQPRQSWFINQKQARKIFLQQMNAIMKYINIWDVDMFWEKDVNGVQRNTNTYSLVDWYKEGFDPNTIISNLVNNRNEMLLLPLSDGEYVKVNEPVGRMPFVYSGGWTIYKYDAAYNAYEKVGQSASSIQFNDYIYNNALTEDDALNMRKMIDVIFNYILIDQYNTSINGVFFALVRYVFTEQPSNDWVFPSTYINLYETTKSLVQKKVYQSDYESQIKDYINEIKPYHTKLRSINRALSGDMEVADLFVTDFDKPPYLDEQKNILILQENIEQKIHYDPSTYYSDLIKSLNVIEYWNFNNLNLVGLNGTTIVNNSGNNTNSETGIYNTSAISSINSTSNLAFTSNSIDISDQVFSYDFWIYTKDNASYVFDATNELELFNNSISNGTNTYNIKIVVKNNNATNDYYMQYFKNNNLVTEKLITISDNQYNYVYVTFENVSSGLNSQYVINNNPISKINIGPQDLSNNPWAFVVNFGNISASSSASCYYDELAIYNSILSGDDQYVHYNAGSSNGSKVLFKLTQPFDYNSLEVYVNDKIYLPPKYTLNGTVLIFNEALPAPVHNVKNIVVKSKNLPDLSILNSSKPYRGYMEVYQSNLDVWKVTVNQKHIYSVYDRVSLIPTFSLEDLYSKYEATLSSQTPLKDFSYLSYKFKGTTGQKFTEADRVAVINYNSDIKTIIDQSYNETISAPIKKNFNAGSLISDPSNVRVFINDVMVLPKYYKSTIDSNNDINIQLYFNAYKNDKLTVRPKDLYDQLILNISNVVGLGKPYHNINEIHGIDFNIDTTTSPVSVDSSGNLVINQTYQDELNAQGDTATIDTLSSSFTNNTGAIIQRPPLSDPSERGVPEELAKLKIEETCIFSFNSNLNIVPKGYETNTPLNVFDSVTATSDGTTSDYPIVLNVPEEQVLVLIDDDEWLLNIHYTLSANSIHFIKIPPNLAKIVITDRYSAYDKYGGKEIYNLKNQQAGGYDGDFALPDAINDKPDFREFIIYTSIGKVFVFTCDETDSVTISNSVSWKDDQITLDATNSKINYVNNGKLMAIYAVKNDGNGKVLETKIEVIHYNSITGNTISDMKRGFLSTIKDFNVSDYTVIKAYPLDINKELPTFLLTEQFVGMTERTSYPKYGIIMTGKD